MGTDDGPLVVDEQRIEVSDGQLSNPGSWVYVWLRRGPSTEVVYVGATGLPPTVRTWLHLNHDEPAVGRVRSQHPEALAGDLTVHAFRLRSSIDRPAVKHAVLSLLDGDAGPYESLDHPVLDAAHEIIARLPVHRRPHRSPDLGP